MFDGLNDVIMNKIAAEEVADRKVKQSILWLLAIIGGIAAVAGIAWFVNKKMNEKALELEDEDFDDFDDYFEDEE